MLTKEGCASRRRRLWETVPDDVQWLLIADPRHVNYLANFWIHPLSWSAGERGLLLLERDNGATLLCDNLAIGSSAGEPQVDRQVVETWYDHQYSAANRDQTLVNRLVELGQISQEEAENHPRKNELQQAVGGRRDVEPAVYSATMKPGDWILVTSDGLINHIKND